jgi:hypothetical protein
MTERQAGCSPEGRKDWAGDWVTLALVWGLPAATMLAAFGIGPMPRAAVWAAMLTWMGAACIANARRCGRTHCRYTGPFFLLMAGFVGPYASGTVPHGPYGWIIIVVITVIGNGLIWWGSERLLGTFRSDC